MNKVWRKFATAHRLLKERGPAVVAKYAWLKLAYKSRASTRLPDWDENTSLQEIFDHYYKSRYWMSCTNLESASSSDSSIEYTEFFRRELEDVIRKYEFKSLLDAPCGDFNWMKLVVKKIDISYIGGDVVKKLINKSSKKFSARNIDFIIFDITSDDFPKTDLWLCRDCLFLLSFRNIFRALKLFMSSEIEYCLITTHPSEKINEDMKDGQYRKLNLLKSPFVFPQPHALLRDFPDWGKERYVGLWRRCDLRAAAKNWPNFD